MMDDLFNHENEQGDNTGRTDTGRRRSKTRRPARLTKAERSELQVDESILELCRPSSRSECRNNGLRPCPFVGCRYNLFLDINPKNGNIKYNFPDLMPQDMPDEESCALDVAEREGATLEEVGRVMNLTRERVRQLEVVGLVKLKGNYGDDMDGVLTESSSFPY